MTILGDIANGIKALKNSNWRDAGKNFGDALAITLFGNEIQTLEEIENGLAGDFVQGFLIGMFKTDVAGKAAECLDVNSVFGHLKNALDGIKTMSKEGIIIAS